MDRVSPVLASELVEVIPHLRRWGEKFEHPEYDVDSLVTDTVITFLKDPSRYDPSKGSLKNVLFSYLKNKAVDFRKSYHRKYKAKFRSYLRSRAPLFVVPKEPEEPSNLHAIVYQHLEKMPSTQALAFRLFAFHGKKYTDIAATLQISQGYAKLLVHRARVRLRASLSVA